MLFRSDSDFSHLVVQFCSPGHAPNYMEVLAEGTELHNKVRNVTITAVEGESLLGRIQED